MARGPVVVDTDVFSARLIPDSLLARRYEPLLIGRIELVSFQTVAELCYGAVPSGWGATRLSRLEAAIAGVETVHSGDDLIRVYADLRAACARVGHALHQREHDADRWIAATAIRLGVPLVSNDRIFDDAPRRPPSPRIAETAAVGRPARPVTLLPRTAHPWPGNIAPRFAPSPLP